MTDIGFYVAVATALASAIMVVRSKNLIHAVLWLGLTLATTAGLYAMLDASFLAGVQILVYIGGIITLMIFGVMITRRHEGTVVAAESANGGRAAAAALGLFGLVSVAIVRTEGLDQPTMGLPPPASIKDLGRALLGEHVLAFEVVSFLLLGAIIGAVVIARRHDAGVANRPWLSPRRSEGADSGSEVSS